MKEFTIYRVLIGDIDSIPKELLDTDRFRKGRNCISAAKIVEEQLGSELIEPLGAGFSCGEFLNGRGYEVILKNITYDQIQETTGEHSQFYVHESFWYVLSEEGRVKIFKNKNIVVMYPTECCPRGFQYQTDGHLGLAPHNSFNSDVITKCKTFKYVIDNLHPGMNAQAPGVEFIPSILWKIESYISHPLSNARAPERVNFALEGEKYLKNMISSINNWDNLPYDFLYLLGSGKLHRVHLAYKMYQLGLDKKGILGSHRKILREDINTDLLTEVSSEWVIRDVHQVMPEKIPMPKYQDEETVDRWVAAEWMFDSKLWVVTESIVSPNYLTLTFAQKEFGYPGIFPAIQITEKTYKPFMYAKPFVISGVHETLDIIKDWGFNNMTDIFGDYRGSDCYRTHENICKIIANIDSYDRRKIIDAVTHNFYASYDAEKNREININYFEKLFAGVAE